MSGGNVRVESDGPKNPLHREIIPSALLGDDAKMVQSFSVIWLQGQDLAIERLGIRQSSGLMVLEGKGEGLWNGHGLMKLPGRWQKG